MFMITAIRPKTPKVENNSMSGMHLNAINGSPDLFGFNSLGGDSYINQTKSQGGMFGPSMSGGYAYGSENSDPSLYQNFQQNTSTPCPEDDRPSPEKRNTGECARTCQTTWRHRQALECLRESPKVSPNVPRRHSLDLDKSASSRQYNEDLLLSLDELDLDLASLSLSESSADQDDEVLLDSQKTDHASQTKRRRFHTTDSAIADRAVKLLAKIKESRKDNNHKTSKNRETDGATEQHGAALNKSAAGSSRHGLQRHWSENTSQHKDKPHGEVRKSKDKKLPSRPSFE